MPSQTSILVEHKAAQCTTFVVSFSAFHDSDQKTARLASKRVFR